MMKSSNKYARIQGYGDLLVPVALLDQLLENCYMVTTSYQDGGDILRTVDSVTRVAIHDRKEIEDAIIQQKLEGEKN